VLAPLVPVLGGQRIKRAMGIAKAAMVRVEHVLAHRLKAILAARKPLGLLVSLIRSGKDWTRPVAAPKGADGVGATDQARARRGFDSAASSAHEQERQHP
jgi:hypothetical protein